MANSDSADVSVLLNGIAWPPPPDIPEAPAPVLLAVTAMGIISTALLLRRRGHIRLAARSKSRP
jgi:hypothetical protein